MAGVRAWLAACGAAAVTACWLAGVPAMAAQGTELRLCNHERVAQVPLRDDGEYCPLSSALPGMT